MHRLQDLARLHRQKTGARETVRLLGIGPNAERQHREALAEARLLDGPPETLPTREDLKAAVVAKYPPPTLPAHQTTSLGAYQAVIEALTAKGLGPRAIFDRLHLEHPEFGCSHSAIKRLCRSLRRARGFSRATWRSRSRRRHARWPRSTSATWASSSTR